ncbi:MAG: hypothetical protein WB755_16510 [Terriglobales bacterium]
MTRTRSPSLWSCTPAQRPGNGSLRAVAQRHRSFAGTSKERIVVDRLIEGLFFCKQVDRQAGMTPAQGLQAGLGLTGSDAVVLQGQ